MYVLHSKEILCAYTMYYMYMHICVHFVSALVHVYALQLKLHVSLNTLLTFVVLCLHCILFRVGDKMGRNSLNYPNHVHVHVQVCIILLCMYVCLGG